MVVNTCGFIDSAKKESIEAILEAARLKTDGKAKRLIVAGCLVERYRDELQGAMPEVDAFIGTSQINDILAVCDPKTNTRSCRSFRSAIRARLISTTNRRRACWRRRATMPSSRSPKAATVPARSVSFRRCVVIFAAAASARSSPKRTSSPKKASRS